jgi:hypothetical protein
LFLFFDVILSWLMGVKVKLDLWLEDEPGAGFLHHSVGVVEKGIWFWASILPSVRCMVHGAEETKASQ